jgi:hypothetical protein
MAAIVWSDVTDLVSEMSSVPLAAQPIILSLVNSYLAVDKWGGEDAPKLKTARIYLAAHLGTFARPGAAGAGAGPVISESEDDVSRAYASFNLPGLDVDPLYDTTPYGRAYRWLMRSNPLLRGMAVV